MSSTTVMRTYRCYDDCQPSGCPGHTALLAFQSTSVAFRFNDGKGNELSFQPPEAIALLQMLKQLADWRVEAANIIEAVRDE